MSNEQKNWSDAKVDDFRHVCNYFLQFCLHIIMYFFRLLIVLFLNDSFDQF